MFRLLPLFAFSIVAATLSGPSFAQRVYVVSSEQPAFAEAARAALLALGSDAVRVPADDSSRSLLAGAEVIVAVGPRAERLVAESLPPNARVVTCFAPRGSSLPAERTVMIPFRPELDEVLALMTLILPSARTIGVFPADQRTKAELANVALRHGLTILAPATGESFDAAVARLVRAADVVVIEDSAAIPPSGIGLVVKRASDAGKHVVGPNRAAVTVGALFAVVPDTTAQGYVAGAVAAQLLRGEAVSDRAAPLGRVVVNGGVAQALGLKFPDDIATRAVSIE